MHLVVFRFFLLNKNFVNLHHPNENGAEYKSANNLHKISSKIAIFTYADTFLSAAMFQAIDFPHVSILDLGIPLERSVNISHIGIICHAGISDIKYKVYFECKANKTTKMYKMINKIVSDNANIYNSIFHLSSVNKKMKTSIYSFTFDLFAREKSWRIFFWVYA